MMSNLLTDELTDTHSVMIFHDPRCNEYVTEVFIKDNGFLWYAVLRYGFEPTLAQLYPDTYARGCKSPRPYRAGQSCDGSITSPVLHLYNQLCTHLGLNPISLYNEAYDDHLFTLDQLEENMRFAEWQAVELIDVFDKASIAKVINSIREMNMHQLANALEENMLL